MMGGGLDGARRIMGGQTLKPKNVSATLARFWTYFRKRWYMLVLVALLLIFNTWTQVTAPEILGQAVDCYLYQPALQAQGAVANALGFKSSCWYTTRDAKAIDADNSLDGSGKLAEKVQGLLGIVGILVALFVSGSVVGGLMFFSMTYAGQNALRDIRVELFRHLHRLS